MSISNPSTCHLPTPNARGDPGKGQNWNLWRMLMIISMKTWLWLICKSLRISREKAAWYGCQFLIHPLSIPRLLRAWETRQQIRGRTKIKLEPVKNFNDNENDNVTVAHPRKLKDQKGQGYMIWMSFSEQCTFYLQLFRRPRNTGGVLGLCQNWNSWKMLMIIRTKTWVWRIFKSLRVSRNKATWYGCKFSIHALSILRFFHAWDTREEIWWRK